MDINIEQLVERLKAELPGWEAQKKLAPVHTREYRDMEKAGKQAAVLALIYKDEFNDNRLIYIKRPSRNPLDKHSGQISFPGGQRESQDKAYRDTALRECYEEIGIPIKQIRILGQLTPLYVYVSDFYVQPFVGFLDGPPKFILQESEVDYVITEKLEYLCSKKSIAQIDYTIRDVILKDMPHYKLGNDILWGATAMMTSELIDIINEIHQTRS